MCNVGLAYATGLLALFCTELLLEGLIGEVVGGMLNVAEKSVVARSEVMSRSREPERTANTAKSRVRRRYLCAI